MDIMKKILVCFSIVGLFFVIFSGCSASVVVDSNDNADLLTTLENELSTENINSTEIYYEYNENINMFINNYNNLNPDDKITKDVIEKYYHHGKEHDNQVKIDKDGFEIVVSDNTKFEIVIDGDKEASSDDYKEKFLNYAKCYNENITNDTLSDYWNQVLDDSINDVEFDNFECRLSMYNDNIEYMQLTGELGN